VRGIAETIFIFNFKHIQQHSATNLLNLLTRDHNDVRKSSAHASRETSMRITIRQIKIVHTLIFWVLSLCVLYSLLSGISGHITLWTWIAVGLVLVESVVLLLSGWTCPLTLLAERLGARRGSVTDLFLPKWFADRIFPICGSTFGMTIVLLFFRLLS
jgi:hypothetical protein